jgi:hypothetical protein
LNPDQFFESDTDGAEPRENQTGKPELPASGATDIFGTVSSAPATEWATVREIPVPAAPPPPAQVPIMSRTPLPVVHEVVFKAEAQSSDGSDPLRQLLRAAPPAPRSAESAPPLPPATPSSGGFTQLLRALNHEQTKPAPPPPAAAAPAVTTAPIAPPPVAVGSITQLLRTIDLSEMAHEALAPAAPAASVLPVQIVSVVETTVQEELRVVEEVRPVASPPPAQVTSFRQEVPAPVSSVPIAGPVEPKPVAPAAAPATAGSFTQLFGTLDTSPAQVAQEQKTPASTGQGGFTQMFEALGTSKVSTTAPPAEAAVIVAPPIQTAAPVQAATAPGSFTQMFQTLDAPAPAPSVPEAPIISESFPTMMDAIEDPPAVPATVDSPPASAAPGSFTQMFQSPVIPQPESVKMDTPAAATPPSVAPSPGSFTQMFRTLDAIEPQPQTSAPESSAGSVTQSFQPAALPVAAERIEIPPAAPASGTFTQMFQSPVAPLAEPVKVEIPTAAPPPPSASSPGAFTQMFRTLDAHAPSAAEPSAGSATQSFQSPPSPPVVAVTREAVPPASSAPGSFTQMFSTPLSQPVAESRPQAPAPGSFTQMFRSLDTPAEPPRSGVPPATGTPGTFTQMFGTLGSPGAEPQRVDTPPARAEAGSFTQLFGTLSDTPPTQPAAPPPAFPPSQPSGSDFGRGGASQVFSTQRDMPEPAYQPSSNAGYGTPAGPPSPATPAGGGLTQLLRTLDYSPQSTPPSASSDPLRLSPQPGTFTSAYGNLEGSSAYPQSPTPSQSFAQPAPVENRDATQAFRAPTAPALPASPPVSAGPSEFTRILNASSFRESLLRGGEAVPAEAAASPAQSAPGMGFPPVAMPPVKMPTAPAMPSGGGGAAPHAWTMPAAPHAPAAPQVPQVKAPELPKVAAPAAGKMQQMLPLMLILIIFLLIAVLVAVVILMKH